MALRFIRNPRVAFVVAAMVGGLWVNQGPTIARYETLVSEARSSAKPLLRAWLPFAFAYRRSADEELYFSVGKAITGSAFDRDVLLAKRGDSSAAYRRVPTADGRWHAPYAEVPFEYPALVLPFILLPALASATLATFAVGFGALMAGLLLVSVHLGIHAAPNVTGPGRAVRWWLAAALFLAQGGLLVQRVDAVVAFFLAIALWAAGRRKPFVMGLGIGLAAAAKIAPILVLFPMMAADREVWRSPGAFGRAAGGLAVGLASGFVPMLALSRSGFADFVRYHAARGLHVESSYGTALSVIGLARGRPLQATLSFGSFNLDGPAAGLCSAVSGPLVVLAVVAFSAWLTLRPVDRSEATRFDGIACAGLGALLCFWLFGKVFSPQYLTWGIPFAVAASVRRPAAALVMAMAISQAYLRGFYDHVVEGRPLGVFALAMRLTVLLVMAAFVLRSLSSGGRPSGTQAAT